METQMTMDTQIKELKKSFIIKVDTYRNKPINLVLQPYSNENILVKIDQYIGILAQKDCPILNANDTDAQNIVEEIVADLNKLKYLLTLE